MLLCFVQGDVEEVFEVAGAGGWRRSCECGGEGGRPDVPCSVCLQVEALRELDFASSSVRQLFVRGDKVLAGGHTVLVGGKEALRGVGVRQFQSDTGVCWW
ncbi:hypothetical protein DEO72_LG5g2763 [Vigna unguiculata]|uniref:Uncharacterized protein n=1 Tax=Vigna unguiculata TaxID=3917 RepID=A0A4D6M248_VIGUN|nr:hypothetical protein DEO72_LG5g2763 [Vigna unguiculata]